MDRSFILPDTDLRVSAFGLGCTKAGRWSDEQAARLLDHFVDQGGNVLDTARIYGLPAIGTSEEKLGRWIASSGKRSRIVLVSKGGHPHVYSIHTPRMTRADMESDLAESLRALRTDCIDIYFYHRDDPSQSVGELLETMETFRKAGRIRYYACSNWTTERMREADEYAAAHGLRGFVGNECQYNMGTRGARPNPDDTMIAADGDMIAYHASGARCVMMPYSGLCEGYFHKYLTSGSVGRLLLKNSCYDTPENRQLAERITALREKYGATISQVLAGFFFTQGYPMLPLFGCSSEAHLDELVRAAEMPFEAADFAL